MHIAVELDDEAVERLRELAKLDGTPLAHVGGELLTWALRETPDDSVWAQRKREKGAQGA